MGSGYDYCVADSQSLARAMCLAPVILGRRAAGGDAGGAD